MIDQSLRIQAPPIHSARDLSPLYEAFSEEDDEHGNPIFLFSSFGFITDEYVAYFGQSKRRKYVLTEKVLIWSALEAKGLGANLQHYNPIIDDEVKKTWNINSDWELVAQMVAGGIVGEKLGAKEKKPVQDRYRTIA